MKFTRFVDNFRATVAELVTSRHLRSDSLDAEVTRKWRDWLGDDLPWTGHGITADEWFFVTTLCGTMTLAGQRTHIRTFFPRFVAATRGDIRNVADEDLSGWKLRSSWMKNRLQRMAAILEERSLTMSQYADELRELDRWATPEQPTPALDRIKSDHRAGGFKTLSLFIRDCVLGNCFPIDSRVQAVLQRYGLPANEGILVRCVLAIGRNPRDIARLFFDAGGAQSFFTGGSVETAGRGT